MEKSQKKNIYKPDTEKITEEKRKGKAYLPTYERNKLIDLLHEKFGFRTHYEILSNDFIRNILKTIKK